jgi:hypothetical protein
MNAHSSIRVVFSCLVLGVALGCSNQATTPSIVDTPAASATALVAPDSTASGQVSASPQRFGTRTPGTVFVTSQGLYFDTFVVKDPLPMHGPFQLLENGRTEFGPGDPGYLGGRWWEDTNGNGVQDPEDHFFLCPLLPPGRPTP